MVGAGAMLGAAGSAVPALADYASLALCGGLGAMIKIGSAPAIRSSVAESVWALAIGIAAAVLFGWGCAHYLARWSGEAAEMLLGPIAGVLGLIGRDWPAVARLIWHWRTGRTAEGPAP